MAGYFAQEKNSSIFDKQQPKEEMWQCRIIISLSPITIATSSYRQYYLSRCSILSQMFPRNIVISTYDSHFCLSWQIRILIDAFISIKVYGCHYNIPNMIERCKTHHR